MKLLNYSEYKNKNIETFENIIDNNTKSSKNIVNNSVDIENKINEITYNKYYNKSYKELEFGNSKQMTDDYKNVIMQEKYVLALSGLAVASIIILTTQL